MKTGELIVSMSDDSIVVSTLFKVSKVIRCNIIMSAKTVFDAFAVGSYLL